MGQEPGTSGSAVSVEARDPDKIRREIEATRQELGDTIEALAEKTDLRAHAKHTMEESNAYVSKKKDDLLAKARETSPQSLVSAVRHAANKARENPVELAAISAFALGFVVGRRSRCSTLSSRSQLTSPPR
jgi:ElaB/YqjD/DUF883 family membrane-anchored ribosome-binding protein